jgi:hypothetical protein
MVSLPPLRGYLPGLDATGSVSRDLAAIRPPLVVGPLELPRRLGHLGTVSSARIQSVGDG